MVVTICGRCGDVQEAQRDGFERVWMTAFAGMLPQVEVDPR